MRIIMLAIVSTITVEKQISNKDKLSYLKDFNEMFEFVKSSVNSVYDMKRAGLSLMLHGMPKNWSLSRTGFKCNCGE